MTDDAKQARRTDPAVLRAHARGLSISNATMDDFLSWATPRQIDAADRLLATELANREDAKRARLLRRARFPVPKSLEGHDFANVKPPDGYTREELLSLDFVPKAQDLVFHGRTGRGKTHPATALGMKAIERDMSVRFPPTAELVLQLGKAKRDGSLDAMLRDIDKADLLILDEFGYVPFDVDGARLLYRIITNSYERRSIIFTTRYPPRTSSSANGARSSRTTNSPPRSSTASSATDGSWNSLGRATASARPSCSANHKTNNQPPAGTPRAQTRKNT